MSSDRILMILMTAVAILAVVPAVPGGEYAALILVGLGLISGFMNPEDDLLTRLAYIVVAVALPTVANSLDAIPVVGGFVNSTESVVGFRFVGLELFGFECKLQCFNVAVLPKQQGGEVAMGSGHGRFVGQSLAEGLLRLIGRPVWWRTVPRFRWASAKAGSAAMARR